LTHAASTVAASRVWCRGRLAWPGSGVGDEAD